jgi:hypothetical protein
MTHHPENAFWLTQPCFEDLTITFSHTAQNRLRNFEKIKRPSPRDQLYSLYSVIETVRGSSGSDIQGLGANIVSR